MIKKSIIIILVIVAVGAIAAGVYFTFFHDTASQKKEARVDNYSFTSCDKGLVNKYIDAVYTTDSRSAYAEKARDYVVAIRNLSTYTNDVNCVFISYEGYVYDDDAEGARRELTVFKNLISSNKVDSAITSYTSVQDMEMVVAGMEHNKQIENSGGEVDGRG